MFWLAYSGMERACRLGFAARSPPAVKLGQRRLAIRASLLHLIARASSMRLAGSDLPARRKFISSNQLFGAASREPLHISRGCAIF
jgi:hypothetical protein